MTRASSAALEVRGLVKHYPAEGGPIRAVDDVSFRVASGELVALFGPSGAGKSTLLLLAAAALAPDRGIVLAGGREVSSLGPREAADYRMHELGFVRQATDLLPGATAAENAALKLIGAGLGVRAARRRVEPLLVELGLGHRLDHRAERLSTGERQRVAIARALSLEPRVVLADEPTGNLDRARKHDVLRILRRVTSERGIATLLVTHDAHAAPYADRVLALEDGRLQTTPEAIAGYVA